MHARIFNHFCSDGDDNSFAFVLSPDVVEDEDVFAPGLRDMGWVGAWVGGKELFDLVG